MRIVLDARTVTPHFPGIGRYTVNLSQAMIPLLDSDEQLILLHDPTQPSPWNLNNMMGPRVQIVDIPCAPFSLAQQWIIPRQLQRLKADVYHSPYYLMPYRLGLPTVVTIHDLIPKVYPNYYTRLQRLIFNTAIRLAARTARQVIAVSQATAVDLRQLIGLPSSKLSVILEAADPYFYAPLPEVTAALRVRFNLPEQYILYVGSNKPHKNLSRLVEAWAIVNRQSSIANCKLIIAGAWDARYPQVRQQVETLRLKETVLFWGPVAETDLPALYSGAMAFAFPSEYEGFGLPVLEAMVCGTPVACSSSASLPEVAGDAALIFDPLNVEAIAVALSRLITDAALRADLRQQGLERAKQFSWRRAAQETLALYQKVVNIS